MLDIPVNNNVMEVLTFLKNICVNQKVQIDFINFLKIISVEIQHMAMMTGTAKGLDIMMMNTPVEGYLIKFRPGQVGNEIVFTDEYPKWDRFLLVQNDKIIEVLSVTSLTDIELVE